MIISPTDKALDELNRIKSEQGLSDDVFLRITIKTATCKGFAYGLEFQSTSQFHLVADTACAYKHNIKFATNKHLRHLLEGTILDFIEVEDRTCFVFKNPNEKKYRRMLS